SYLVSSLNSILPDVRLTEGDVDFHYAAVRPLPYVDASTPAAVTRRHALVRHEHTAVPLFSVVGGKLTTMRALAELTAQKVLAALGCPVGATSEDRPIPGAAGYPADAQSLARRLDELSAETGYPRAAVAAGWALLGTRTADVLKTAPDRELLPDVDLPCTIAR